MNNNRDIEDEIETEMERRMKENGVWQPWGPLNWPDDYGDYEYYADRLKRKNKLGVLNALRNVREKIIEFRNDTGIIDNLTDFETYESERFVEWLQNECDLTDKTVDLYVGTINNMAAFYAEANYYNGNPFAHIERLQKKSSEGGLLTSNRIEIPIQKLRSAVEAFGVRNTNTVILITLAKTGIRISELCNLDNCDLNIDHPIWNNVTVRNEIEDKPDTIWIDSEKEKESFTDKTNGNKRKISTPIPIDTELKRLFVWYALVRPELISNGLPFFVSNKKHTGTRLTCGQAYYLVRNWSEQNGFWSEERDEMYNLTPHWFRAFFTTTMQNNISSEDIESLPVNVEKFVKGLRGDAGGDVIDRYTQVYEGYRDVVTENQPKFGV